MQRISLKVVFREKEFWILILLGILYFYRPLFLGETFFFRDLCLHDLPDKQLLVDFINAGELPLWDPYKHGGRPYLANIIHFTFYPLNLLYLFLPLIKAFNLNIVLHFIGCSTFAYLFSRVIGLQPVSGFIVGLIYGFCGYVLSLANILNRILAMPYIPLLLLFWHLFLLEGKRKWFVMTVIVGVLQVFTGAPETNIISLLLLLGWILVYPYSHRSVYQKSTLWLLLGIFIVGIASVQLFPAIEAVSLSSRGQGLNYFVFSRWSLHPNRLPEIFFPGFLGHVDKLLWEVYYWGRNLIDNEMPYILSIYCGGVVLALACVGGLYKEGSNILPFRLRVFLFLLFIFSLILSLGRFLPGLHFLHEYIPFITLFRYPIKFFIIGLLPLAFLAGYASEVLFRRSFSPSQQEQEEKNIHQHSNDSQGALSLKFLPILWGVSAILLLFTLTFRLSDNFAKSFQKLFFKQLGGEIAFQGLLHSFIHASTIWFLVTLLYQYRCMRWRQWQHWILAVILIVDLFLAGKVVNVYAPETFFTDIPDMLQLVRKEVNDGRFFRDPKEPSHFSLQVPSYDIMWLYRWDLEVLKDYIPAFYKIPVIFHSDVDGMADFYLKQLTDAVHLLSWEQRLPLLSTGGVTLILTSDDISAPGVYRIAEIPNRSNVPFYLYRNETAAARVEFITNWKHVASDDEALRAMLRPGYDPRDQVVLQEPESTLFDWHFKTPKSQETASNFSGCDDPSQIKKIASNTPSTVFLVSNNCDGYLVFSEPFYPGWRVYVDGKSIPILRANYAFSAVFLKAGEYRVERHYRPNSLFIGTLSSILFCALLGVITYRGWLKIGD